MNERILYFDLDGIVVMPDRARVKPALGAGALERAIRVRQFDRLVCVGNFAVIVHRLVEVEPDYDGLGVLFGLCQGAFESEEWFRSRTSFVEEPGERTRYIRFDYDWWYVDDLAGDYFRAAGQEDVFEEELGRRVHVTPSQGSGDDVLGWLEGIPGRFEPAS